MTTEDALLMLVEGAREWRASLADDGWEEADIRNCCRPGMSKIFDAIYALDAAAYETPKNAPN